MKQHEMVAHVTAALEEMDPGTIVQRFVLVAEVDSPDEGRAVWVIPTEEMTSWDSLGLLHFAQVREEGRVLIAEVED